MNYGVIQPPEQIADYVRFFWFSEANASVDNPYVHEAFAYPCPELIFCYKGEFRYKSQFEAERIMTTGIYGQTASFSNTFSNVNFGVFGVYFYPQCLPQLFGVPANVLTNQYADLKFLLGREGEILEEKIMLARNFDHRVKIVSDFLIARLNNVRAEYNNICSAIKLITNTYKSTSVKVLATDNFLSVRQFERKFKQLSGFSPKLFLRIARFNSLLNKPLLNKSLTQMCYEYGYHDQSHFVHDFQIFSGSSPKEYFKQETLAASDRGTIKFEI